MNGNLLVLVEGREAGGRCGRAKQGKVDTLTKNGDQDGYEGLEKKRDEKKERESEERRMEED